MKKNRMKAPRALVESSKDTRHAGTFDVLVPVPDRVRPHRVASQFATAKAAEDWIHSAEGAEVIDRVLIEAGVKIKR